MKRLLFYVILALVSFTSNAQVVTIDGFGTSTTFGPVMPTNTITDILLDKSAYMPSEDLPIGYKYIIDFDNSECKFYDGNGELVVVGPFKVINKQSDRDFQIQFTDPTLDSLENTYGIIVKDSVAAHTEFNGLAVFLTIFEALYIY
jgi:hypothetical protein